MATKVMVKSLILSSLKDAVRLLDTARKAANRQDEWPLTAEAAYVGAKRLLNETQLRFKVGWYNAGGGSDTN